MRVFSSVKLDTVDTKLNLQHAYSYIVKIKTQCYEQENTWIYYSKMVEAVTQVVDGGQSVFLLVLHYKFPLMNIRSQCKM